MSENLLRVCCTTSGCPAVNSKTSPTRYRLPAHLRFRSSHHHPVHIAQVCQPLAPHQGSHKISRGRERAPKGAQVSSPLPEVRRLSYRRGALAPEQTELVDLYDVYIRHEKACVGRRRSKISRRVRTGRGGYGVDERIQRAALDYSSIQLLVHLSDIRYVKSTHPADYSLTRWHAEP